MKPTSSFSTPTYPRRSLIYLAALGLLGFSALAGQSAASDNTSSGTNWFAGDGITWTGIRPKMLDRGVELFIRPKSIIG